jgi:hypothetical protein
MPLKLSVTQLKNSTTTRGGKRKALDAVAHRLTKLTP